MIPELPKKASNSEWLFIHNPGEIQTTFPVITVISARFGIPVIGTFGKITAKAVQFSSSFLLA
jgi:hypothetical protein